MSLLPSGFALERDLKDLLKQCPELLRDDSESDGGDTPQIKLVGEEINLEAGDIDLLFVDSSGRLILVETKLNVNPGARRQIVAQAIDYLSALTQLTARELNTKVGGKLKLSLADLAGDDEEGEKFDSLWESAERNLRAGRTRVVMALDKAPQSLERIFLLLTQKSELDVRLLAIERYAPATDEEIIVTRFVVRRMETPPDTPKELLAAEEAFNKISPDLKTHGHASNYRIVIPGKGPGKPVGIMFFQQGKYLGVKAGYEGDDPSVQTKLESAAGKSVSGNATLEWKKDAAGKCQLVAKFPLETSPDVIAQAMLDLLRLTGLPAR